MNHPNLKATIPGILLSTTPSGQPISLVGMQKRTVRFSQSTTQLETQPDLDRLTGFVSRCGPARMGRCMLAALLLFVGGCSSWTPASHPQPSLRCLASRPRPMQGCSGGLLRLRGGIGEAIGSLSDRASGIARDVAGNEWHEFGTGPGHTDRSGSKFEARPTGLYDAETHMDGGCASCSPSAPVPFCCSLTLPILPSHHPSTHGQRIQDSSPTRNAFFLCLSCPLAAVLAVDDVHEDPAVRIHCSIGWNPATATVHRAPCRAGDPGSPRTAFPSTPT